jgi:hypothetical protein
MQHVRVMICPRCGETVRVEENPPTGRPPSSPDDPGESAMHTSSLEVGVKRRNEDGFGTARGVEIRFNGALVHQCGDDQPESSRRLVQDVHEAIQQMQDEEWYFSRVPVGIQHNDEAPADLPYGYGFVSTRDNTSWSGTWCSFCGRDIGETSADITNAGGTEICRRCARRAADALDNLADDADNRMIGLPPVVSGKPADDPAVREITQLFDVVWSPFDDGFLARFVIDADTQRLNSRLKERWTSTAPFMFYTDRIEFVSDDEATIEVRLVLRPRDALRGHVARTPAGWRMRLDVMQELARMGGVA